MSAAETIVPPRLPEFKQPEVMHGDIVMYYPNCSRQRPLNAHVNAINVNSINVCLLGDGVGKVFYGVRHIDDPSLESNDNFKKAGGWDFPPRQKQLEARLKAIYERIQMIERRKS